MASDDGWVDVPVPTGPANDDDEWEDVAVAPAQLAVPLAPRPSSRLESMYRGAKQGASLGFSDEIYGGAAALADAIRRGGLDHMGEGYRSARDASRGEDKVARDANPYTYDASSVGGGLAGLAAAVASLPATAAAAATGVGGAAALGAASGLGSSKSDLTKGDVGGAAVDTAIGGALGYGFGKAGEKISNAVAKRIAERTAARGAGTAANAELAGESVGSITPVYGPSAKPGAPTFQDTVGSGSRAADADRVLDAARSLPGSPKLPPWMLTSDRVAQDAASTALRSPSIGGALVRREAKPVLDSMRQAATDITGDASTEMTSAQAGEAIRDSVKNAFGRKIAPAAAEYEALEPILAATKLDPENHAWGIVSDALTKDSRVLTNPEARQFLATMGEEFKNIRTLADLKAFRSNLREASSRLGGTAKYVAQRLQDAATSLRDETLRTAGTQGEQALQRLRGADRGFREAVEQAGESFGVQPYRMTPESAVDDFIEGIPKEGLSEKLFSPKNLTRLEALAKYFPEEFDQVRRAELARITRDATARGEVDPLALAHRISKYQPEVRALLFGEKAGTAEALQSVRQALPREVNPSGTSVRTEFTKLLDPATQLSGLNMVLKTRGGATGIAKNAAIRTGRAASAPVRMLARPAGAAVAGTSFAQSDRVSFEPKSILQRVRSSPKAARFAPVLESAAQRGDDAVATTHFLLQQQEPEYRKAFQETEE